MITEATAMIENIIFFRSSWEFCGMNAIAIFMVIMPNPKTIQVLIQNRVVLFLSLFTKNINRMPTVAGIQGVKRNIPN